MTVEYLVKNALDLEKAHALLSGPYEPPRPDCSEFFTQAESLGERGLLICHLRAPIHLVYRLMGSQTMALLSVTHRSLLRELTEILTERTVVLVDYLLEQGVGPVFGVGGVEVVAPPLHGPQDFHEFAGETEPAFLSRIRETGGLVHCHCHGSLGRILEEFAEMGYNAVHPVEAPPMGDVTLEEAKRRLAGQVCIEGNLQISEVYCQPTAQFVDQVRRCIEVGAPGGGFILSTSATPYTRVLPDQAVRNYLALIETVVEETR
jgi:uroporphyrinogen-III decarboxylase